MPSRTRTTKADIDDGKKTSSLSILLQKMMAVDSKPTEETFEELPNVIFWMRAVIGAALGIFLGVQKFIGASVLMHCLNCLFFIPVTYVYLYLGVKTDSDQFGGIWKLLWLGVAPAMGLCLLVWIYILTASNEQQVELLNTMLVNVTVNGTHDASAEGGNVDKVAELQSNDAKEF
ncbi:hypothetical protein MPSEU_000603700 [Mayamaea pseudoterrestris]|nr:hypothetical protein MPSEU_000603700 [Mayamaea pseudoterrestris]